MGSILTQPSLFKGIKTIQPNFATIPSDINQAHGLIDGKAFDSLLGDKGYDANALIEYIEEQGAQAVIPAKSNRKVQREHDHELYKKRNNIERFFNRIKQSRRIATRYDKTDCCFLAFIALAAICVWLH